MKEVGEQIEFILESVRRSFPDLNSILEKERLYLSQPYSSTEVRTLMSSQYYERVKDNYNVINCLSGFIYKLYREDDKRSSRDIITSNEDFTDSIIRLRPENKLFWEEEYWQFDEYNKMIRKESERREIKEGYYLKRQFIQDENSKPTEEKFQNIELAHPTSYVIEGFKYIIGKNRADDTDYIRFYWNFLPARLKIENFMRHLQLTFDEAGIPYEFKVLINPLEYINTSDTAVLYVPQRHSMTAFRIVGMIHFKFKDVDLFSDNVPLFTFRLERGLSFGEDPVDTRYTSFGRYRSVCIAMAIGEHYKKYNLYPSLEYIVKWLSKEGFDFQHFYLNQYSPNIYKNEINLFRYTYHDRRRYGNRNKGNKSYTNFLEGAKRIGDKIVKNAIWYNWNCNWMSFEKTEKITDPDGRKTQIIGYSFKALDISFEEGCLGVAFFLKKLNYYYKRDEYYRVFNAVLKRIVNTINNPKTIVNDDLKFKGILYGLKLCEDEKNRNNKNLKKALQKLEQVVSTRNSYYFDVKREENVWRGLSIDQTVSGDSDVNLEIAVKILDEFILVDRPFGNAMKTNEFEVSLLDGYAFLGYYFLKIYDPLLAPLPFKFNVPAINR